MIIEWHSISKEIFVPDCLRKRTRSQRLQIINVLRCDSYLLQVLLSIEIQLYQHYKHLKKQFDMDKIGLILILLEPI